MQISKLLTPDLIFIDEDVSTSDDLFERVADKAKSLGYINNEFIDKIKKREKKYPTGLQLKNNGVAIPHTDADTIEKQFIAIVVPENPVLFQRMDNPAETTEVEVAFVLGLNEPHSQVEMLQELMGLFQQFDIVDQIKTKKNEEELINYLESVQNN